MLKCLTTLPEAKHFRQIDKRGDRYQWCDRSTDCLRILSPDPHPWDKEQAILIRLEQGKTRAGIEYPKRLHLLVIEPEPGLQRVRLIRERWTGNFAHSVEPTLLFFAFPAEAEEGQSWLMFGAIAAPEPVEPAPQPDDAPQPLVSHQDEHLLQFKWRVTANGWVRRFRQDGKQRAVYLHREILGLTGDQSRQVVFRNSDRLDCRRENLEVLTMAELVAGAE